MSGIFHALIYNPLYNGIAVLMNAMPWADLGIIVVVFTIIVKLILFPLAHKSVKTQVALRALEPELQNIRKKYKNREEQARRTMELYKVNGINPFSGFLLILIQLPIIFALYFIFVRGGLPVISPDLLYSFVPVPNELSATFFGSFHLLENSLPLAIVTGVAQFLQGYLVSPKISRDREDTSLSASFAQSMQIQVKYIMPIIITFIAYKLPSVVALYWITSTVFTIFQELVVRRTTKFRTQGVTSGNEVSA